MLNDKCKIIIFDVSIYNATPRGMLFKELITYALNLNLYPFYISNYAISVITIALIFLLNVFEVIIYQEPRTVCLNNEYKIAKFLMLIVICTMCICNCNPSRLYW
jgi:amino acid permease